MTNRELIERAKYGAVVYEAAAEVSETEDGRTAKEAHASLLRDLAKALEEAEGEKLAEPDMSGGFVGDIWFGDPRNSTRGTHRWDGAKWSELPSDLEVTLELLAAARARAEKAEAENLLLREALTEMLALYDTSLAATLFTKPRAGQIVMNVAKLSAAIEVARQALSNPTGVKSSG